jgi:hypothetical protein
MKRCTKCGEHKLITEFNRHSTSVGGRRQRCKSCTAEDVRPAQAAKYAEFREWLWGLKANPCVDCGNAYHPAAMQFDHLPEFEKKFEVSAGAFLRRRDVILAEIAKCELVCSNCHAVRTYERRLLTKEIACS